MKNIICILLSVFLPFLSIRAQVINSRFKPIPYEVMYQAAAAASKVQQDREQYLNSLIEYTTNILSKDIDPTLRQEIQSIYQNLKRYIGESLLDQSRYTYLQQQEVKIRDAVINYNTRERERQVKVQVEELRQAKEAEQKAQEQAKYAPSSGSGFFLSKDGYIATNYHVIEDARSLAVTGIKGDYNTTYSVSVEQIDSYNDLAILKINDSKFIPFSYNPPYKIRYNQAEIGENCYVLGYPLISTMGVDIKLTNGIISARTGFQGDVSQYQISAPVQPGNSGGPLFDKNGNIIGVVSAKHTEAENAGYAIKMSYLQNLIELSPTKISLPQYNSLTGKTLPEQVKGTKNYVCIILANVLEAQPNSDNKSFKREDPTPEIEDSVPQTQSQPNTKRRTISPVYVNRQYCDVKITSIELYTYYTVINLSVMNTYDEGGWCNIAKDTRIIADNKSYKMITEQNIAVAPNVYSFKKKGDILEFSLVFPGLPTNVKKIDLIEGEQSTWRFYGISLE